MTDFMKPTGSETIDDFLWRLGCLKESGAIQATWVDLAAALNAAAGCASRPFDESSWRKRFRKLQMEAILREDAEAAGQRLAAKPPENHASNIVRFPGRWNDSNSVGDTDGDNAVNNMISFPPAKAEPQKAQPQVFVPPEIVNKIDAKSVAKYEDNENLPFEEDIDEDEDPYVNRQIIKLQKEKALVRDERTAYNRSIRKEARADAILQLFADTIARYQATELNELPSDPVISPSNRAVYAMLSDIHYGLCFDSDAGVYSPEIARERVMHYAQRLAAIGKENGANICFVSLMGDMISGAIHSSIRAENRENVVEQVIGVSELVSDFLKYLADHFSAVCVNSVAGNHSRIDLSADDALRSEKLDTLVPWYCKTKLENLSNVMFVDDDQEATWTTLDIGNATYLAVHGDFDRDLNKTAAKVERVLGKRIDYVLAGHLHVPEMRMDDRGFIRNGAVCGSGDEYTMKKRLFAPPQQVCMLVNGDGVEAVYPVGL